MTVVRQDAWTPDDDLILAEVTLRHIREGGTQLEAFEEVGEKLGRTAAACGFRWNSCVRKKYEAAIQIAKAQRKQRKQAQRNRPSSRALPTSYDESAMTSSTDHHEPIMSDVSIPVYSELEEELSFDAVIRFLKNQKNLSKRIKQMEKELEEKEEELVQLRQENNQMNKQLNHALTDYQVVNEDYRTLIQIMDRARKMALLTDDEDLDAKPKFKMDANGNLERVD
ncbi:precorrin-3B C(17)-methyltransferase [Ammoniphilus oxalaticus]|uniref:Precorrin-3B C(17)-methyltransferase n=1 Tax=Ammoniphilus oxalaticus TaxID=66863 RepID=A0A419SJ78_9BACL|nr:RsfA family transcriptional regulator [Ammoniphilus oxalaticus]RKD24081.1 precorrin-3B C(17)-methyltransferase [Ammoniphilus oxalaticus]